MATPEPIDYPAELTRIARAALDPRNPGDIIAAMDGRMLMEAAQLMRQMEYLIGGRPTPELLRNPGSLERLP